MVNALYGPSKKGNGETLRVHMLRGGYELHSLLRLELVWCPAGMLQNWNLKA